MARLWSRRSKTSATPTDEPVWWDQEAVTEAWRPSASRPDDAPERDILADHLGEDWRTDFGFDTEGEGGPTDDVDGSDPYDVLAVPSTASWDEIVAAHRQQARAHHPDLHVGESPEETAANEDRIRVINAAYKELQVRRGM